MAGPVQSLLRGVRRRWNGRRIRSHNRGEFDSIRASKHAILREIGRAVEEVTENAFDRRAEEAFGRIESVRRELATQTDRKVVLTDYGAGDPNQEYSAEASSRGVVVTRAVAAICQSGGLSPLWNRVLFQLIRRTNRLRGLELGCSLGLSAAYQGTALSLNSGAGRLVTLDGAAPLAEIARENWRNLGVSNVEVVVGRFQDTLPGVLAAHRPFDYAFIDGHHDGDATLDYMNRLLANTSTDAVLVFDDILWYEGMKRAWHRIQRHPRVLGSVDLGVLGVVLTSTHEVRQSERYSFDLSYL